MHLDDKTPKVPDFLARFRNNLFGREATPQKRASLRRYTKAKYDFAKAKKRRKMAKQSRRINRKK